MKKIWSILILCKCKFIFNEIYLYKANNSSSHKLNQ